MDLIDFIRFVLFVFIGIGLVILALNPTKKRQDDYRNWIDYLDKEARESRKRHGLSRKDDD